MMEYGKSSIDGDLVSDYNNNYSTELNETAHTAVGSVGGKEEELLFPIPTGIVVVLSLFYGSISLLSVIGNGLVLWVVAVSRRMRTVTNMFIANLALADITIGLFAIPFQFQAALLQRWNLPEFMCAFCPFVQVLSVNVSVFTLAMIALDRYKAVLHPLSARPSKRKATFAIFAIWLVGFLIAVPTELDYRVVYKTEQGYPKGKPVCELQELSDSFRKGYLLALVILQYFFPLVIITAAYARMAGALWGATVPGNAEDSRDAAILRNKKKVIKMLAVVVLLFAVCWLPLQTYNFLSHLINPAINDFQYINMVWFGMHLMAMSNSCCNPFIYAIYNGKFQREFKARLRCLHICRRHRRTDSPNSELSYFDHGRIRASYRFRGSARNGGCINGNAIGANHDHYLVNGKSSHEESEKHLKPNIQKACNALNNRYREETEKNNRNIMAKHNGGSTDGSIESLCKEDLSQRNLNNAVISDNIPRIIYTKNEM